MNFEDDFSVLSKFLKQVQIVLEQKFVGLYLHGSLALGDFDLATSDIDFAIVTQNLLEPETMEKLALMHNNLLELNPKTAKLLEGAYIPSSMIRQHDSHIPAIPHVHGDSFYLAQLEPHWVLNRAILRESGVILAGPKPDSLIDPVSIRDRKRAVRDFLHDWWQPLLTDSTKFEDAEYRVYAVQTMTRALCTLEIGELRSKPSAIRWALEYLPDEWHETFQRRHPTTEQTIELLKYTIQLGNSA